MSDIAANEGIEKLYTVGNSLIAISDSDDVYIWDWKELDSEPIIQTVPSEKLLCLDSGKIIIAPSNKPATVTVTNLKQSNKNKPFSFGYNWLCKHLSVTRNGQWVALAFIGKTGSSSTKRIRLAILGPGSEYPKEVLTLNYQKDATVLNETVISEIRPKLKVVDKNTQKLQCTEEKVEYLSQQNDIAVQ
ncbi:hypothetical protein LCGC14_3035000, partial [marine sediment metagenome]